MDSTVKNLQGPLCTQCGECCRKGGPLLHMEDMPLVYEGHICFSKLVTLRSGELAYDGVQDCLKPLENEVVKIIGTKEQAYPWHCVFHKGNVCALYPLRPAQCAALFCEDTASLEAMYEHNLATRANVLLHAPQGWQELAIAHEEQCSLQTLTKLLAEYAQHQDEILQLVRYDMAFRELCVQKAAMPENVLDCVLGRNLSHFLSSFGLELSKNAPHLRKR